MHFGGRKLDLGFPIDKSLAWMRGLFTIIR